MPWSTESRHARGYGAEHERMRDHLLRNVVLCEECTRQGRVTPGTVADHIQPLSTGGTSDRANYQLLCKTCHDAKTVRERGETGGHTTHPAWVKPSAIPLAIVCGPPCAGKSTYVAERARIGDTIIDFDVIATTIEPTYRHWSGAIDRRLMTQTMRTRNAALGALATATRGQAWFIVSAPAPAERRWWMAKLGGEVVLLDPGREECIRRAAARGTPRAILGVDTWHHAARQPWQPHTPRRSPSPRGIGADGWPTEGWE